MGTAFPTVPAYFKHCVLYHWYTNDTPYAGLLKCRPSLIGCLLTNLESTDGYDDDGKNPEVVVIFVSDGEPSEDEVEDADDAVASKEGTRAAEETTPAEQTTPAEETAPARQKRLTKAEASDDATLAEERQPPSATHQPTLPAIIAV